MWDGAVSFRTQQSYIDGKEQYHVGQINIIWDRPVGIRQSHLGQSSLMWDRAVSFGIEKSRVGQSSLMWDGAV